jgi:hypothetical protein
VTTFSADVDDWVNESKVRILTVFQEATQAMFYGVLSPVGGGGRMRVDTGFLRASFAVSLDNPILRVEKNPSPRRSDDGGGIKFPFDSGPISLVINQADVGQTIYGMFTANYARPREYGARGKPGDGFVMTNAARWQDYVNEATLKVKAGS